MNIFNVVKSKSPKRSNFDLGHEVKLSCQFGDLIPVLCEDVIPGDKWQVSSEIMARLAPMVAPVMHNVDIYTHFFFVPDRLVFDESKDFYTGGEDGLQEPEWPFFGISDANKSQYGPRTLADYLGIKIDTTLTLTDNINVSATPFRAYGLIYNEYYRDQNLENKVPVFTAPGSDQGSQRNLLNRAYEKDYFTSALPFAQRGGEVVTPIQGSAPVSLVNQNNPQVVKDSSGGPISTGDNSLQANDTTGNFEAANLGSPVDAFLDPQDTLAADLSQATSTTINEFRLAYSIQKWLERNARGGSRYIEQMLSHFGVKSSDSRLQRPEYLGGGKTPIMMSEVLQTSSTASDVQIQDTPQGNMAGHGLSVGKSNRFSRYFEEHGQIMGIMSIVPRTAYSQGIRRQFTKFDRYDKFWPDFAHLGEQEIKYSEVFVSGLAAEMQETWGYQPRYIEYKNIPSSISGEFRTTLNYWNLGREFATRPNLNADFVKCKHEDSTKIFAITDETVDTVYVSIYHNIKASRKMPYLGTPMLEV